MHGFPSSFGKLSVTAERSALEIQLGDASRPNKTGPLAVGRELSAAISVTTWSAAALLPLFLSHLAATLTEFLRNC